jgi:hypothetical protein
VPGRQGEHEQRHELGQPDPAQVQRAAVQGVDLPADGHLEHLQANAHGQQRQPPPPEAGDAQRGREVLHADG